MQAFFGAETCLVVVAASKPVPHSVSSAAQPKRYLIRVTASQWRKTVAPCSVELRRCCVVWIGGLIANSGIRLHRIAEYTAAAHP